MTSNEIRKEYLARSAERLDQIAELINSLNKAPADNELLSDLTRQFHWMAHSGAIYGFPQITKLGTQGEDLCEDVLNANRALAIADLEKCNSLLEELRINFSAAD